MFDINLLVIFHDEKSADSTTKKLGFTITDKYLHMAMGQKPPSEPQNSL